MAQERTELDGSDGCVSPYVARMPEVADILRAQLSGLRNRVWICSLAEWHGKRPWRVGIDDVRWVVILDLTRIVIGRCLDDRAEGAESLAWFLAEAHPVRPYKLFAACEQPDIYRFPFDWVQLEIVSHCAAELREGEYLVLDLVTGELHTGEILQHPTIDRLSISSGPTTVPRESPMRGVVTGASLRSGPAPDLERLVNRHAGVIREETLLVDHLSLPGAAGLVSWAGGTKSDWCYGKAFTPLESKQVARCEAAERFQVVHLPRDVELVRGSYAELAEHAVNPVELFPGVSGGLEGEGTFDPQTPICWTWAWGPAEKRWRLVPAQDLWYSISERMHERRMFEASTSGAATGITFEEAAVAATLEAVERDGLLVAWYVERPAIEIDQSSFASESLRLLIQRFRIAFPGHRLVLYDLTTDVGIPTIGALALKESGEGPAAYFGAAAHLSPEGACFRAVKDLSWMPRSVSAERRPRLTEQGSPVSAVRPAAHHELYARDENRAAFDYLRLGSRPAISVGEVGNGGAFSLEGSVCLSEVLLQIDERLRSVGAALFIKDITHPAFAAHGLRIARAVTPGLYPIWFGPRPGRFSVTNRLRRLCERYTGRALDPAGVRLSPHPLG